MEKRIDYDQNMYQKQLRTDHIYDDADLYSENFNARIFL